MDSRKDADANSEAEKVAADEAHERRAEALARSESDRDLQTKANEAAVKKIKNRCAGTD